MSTDYQKKLEAIYEELNSKEIVQFQKELAQAAQDEDRSKRELVNTTYQMATAETIEEIDDPEMVDKIVEEQEQDYVSVKNIGKTIKNLFSSSDEEEQEEEQEESVPAPAKAQAIGEKVGETVKGAGKGAGNAAASVVDTGLNAAVGVFNGLKGKDE